MSVTNGQQANQTTFNNAFVSKTATSGNTATGIINLDNTSDVNSGNTINNTQRFQNEIADSDGTVGTGDATRKTYSSNNIVANGDNRKVAIGKLDAEFDSATGHTHDGTAGSGGPISASNLDDFNAYYAVRQSFTITGAAGADDTITTQMSGKTPGGGTSALGVVTSGTYNRCEIRDSSTDTYIEDAGGQRVYGRITESGGVWTLTYYTNEAGVETSHTLSSTNIRVFFIEVFNQETRPTFSEDVGYLGSLDLTADIVDASTSTSGKVNTGSQSFAGSKNFTDGILVSSSMARPRTDVAGGTLTALTYSPFVKITGVTATTISGIASGSDGKSIILHNGTTQLLTLNHEDGGATAANRLKLPAAANIILGTDESIEFVYESSASRWVQKSGSGSGSGSGGLGGVNFLILDTSWQATKTDNSTADVAIGDWLTYDDGASSVPIDMTGGSPSAVTLSRTTTGGEILNGSASFKIVKTASSAQGEGAACVGYVPLGYRGQQCMISFAHKIISGSIVDGDVGIYVYDVTNSNLLTPNNNSLIGSNNVNKMDVYIPATCAQIRIGFHFKSTSTTAVTFTWDDIQIGPQEVVFGPTMTEWELFNGLVASSGFNSPNIEFYSRQIGDTRHFRGHLTLTGAAAATVAYLEFPSSIVIDSTKLSSTANVEFIGSWYFNRTPSTAYGSSNFLGNIFYDGSTTNQVFFASRGVSDAMDKVNANDVSTSSGNTVVIEFSVPIQGASANVVTQNTTSFWLSNILANGTRVTGSAPTELGQYRSYLRNAGAQTYTETNGAPAISPSVTNGIALYHSAAYATGDANNEPSKYEIFIGRKEYLEHFYQNTGRSGFADVTPFDNGAYSSGVHVAYDESSQILSFTANTFGGRASQTLGVDDNSGSLSSPVYFDALLSEKVIPVQIGDRSEIFVTEGNGQGSTNTVIRRFSNVLIERGSSISYTDSATDGALFKINQDGCYSMNYQDGVTSGSINSGISLNSSQLTTAIGSITSADCIGLMGLSSTILTQSISATLWLNAGDEIRVHGEVSGNYYTTGNECRFRITKVS